MCIFIHIYIYTLHRAHSMCAWDIASFHDFSTPSTPNHQEKVLCIFGGILFGGFHSHGSTPGTIIHFERWMIFSTNHPFWRTMAMETPIRCRVPSPGDPKDPRCTEASGDPAVPASRHRTQRPGPGLRCGGPGHGCDLRAHRPEAGPDLWQGRFGSFGVCSSGKS